MLTAYNEQQERVLAQHAEKATCYFCPVCHERMILKKGCRNIAHFAHPRQSTHQGVGESALHHRLKLRLFHMLSIQYPNVQLEPYLSEIQQIPDIVVGQYAIEIQLSAIPVQQMIKRTEGLAQVGYHVIWLSLLPKYRRGVYYFNQLQQACIAPDRHVMYAIHPTNCRLYRLSNVMSITARQFVADCARLDDTQLLTDYETDLPVVTTVRKLSTVRILQYLRHCRHKDTVHEPTLSIIYRMQLTETQVIQYTGYIFPEQIYVTTHPVLWQLKVFEALTYQRDPYTALQRCIKLRYFATGGVSRQQLIKQLVERYKKILK
ncbi:hypothetical protein TP70_06525 [Staphylococcus microti]|uniref:Transcription factor n=1 Tax=Staphylococcus microti TaxID=569857 RepID=A0A0D6XQ67_9STAP|nr:competence protein CoiA family protein [Staphylococcus microti]KIX90570.1 hypothetical protein TP70_06525 [Staphylococcus microti]PNZ77243.1 competence protein CoiA [Staphylococcus microti]SUM56976.1 transcription factor [Staphylococcus microti]